MVVLLIRSHLLLLAQRLQLLRLSPLCILSEDSLEDPLIGGAYWVCRPCGVTTMAGRGLSHTEGDFARVEAEGLLEDFDA
ncbi:unnamed protein product [Lathyrus oleraceus]